MTTTERSAVVIGAGPGGCAAALTLARLGVRVTLIEKRAFPRVKVCGEYISPAGVPTLESLVSPAELLERGAKRVDLFAIDLPGREPIEWRTPAPAWALSRAGLDEFLVERVVGAGVEVMQPVSVSEVAYFDDGVTVGLSGGESLDADIVVHADGSGRHDPAGPTPTAPGIVGHKCHIRVPSDQPIEGVRMRPGPGAYVGTIAVEDGLATCALVAKRAHIAKHRGDADAMLGDLWPGFDPAWRAGAWLSCGVHRSGYIAPGHHRSFRVGNAAGAVDPVGGEGIGLALWAGATLGKLLGVGLGGCSPWNGDTLCAHQRVFARAYQRRLRFRRPACRVAAEWLMRPGLVGATWPIAKRPALAIAPWYRLSGKPGRPGRNSGTTLPA